MNSAQPSATRAASPQTIHQRILADTARARLHVWGLADYAAILDLQQQFRDQRRAGLVPDTWLAGEHPPVITQGVRGKAADLRESPELPVFQIDRGGLTTIHNPGQLVIYPILKVRPGLLAQARLSRTLLAATRDWLADLFGLDPSIHKGRPGLFLGERKLAAIGVSIRGGVSMHGIAINCCNDLAPWRAIVPCGEPSISPVTLSEALARRIEPAELIEQLPSWIGRSWGYDEVSIKKEI